METRPKEFTDENVIVVGMGHTGVDVTDALIGHAASISISHNSGAIVVSSSNRPPLLSGRPAQSNKLSIRSPENLTASPLPAL